MELLFLESGKESRLKIILESTMNRVTLLGAVFLALIAILTNNDWSLSWVFRRRSAISLVEQPCYFSWCCAGYDETNRISSADEAL